MSGVAGPRDVTPCTPCPGSVRADLTAAAGLATGTVFTPWKLANVADQCAGCPQRTVTSESCGTSQQLRGREVTPASSRLVGRGHEAGTETGVCAGGRHRLVPPRPGPQAPRCPRHSRPHRPSPSRPRARWHEPGRHRTARPAQQAPPRRPRRPRPAAFLTQASQEGGRPQPRPGPSASVRTAQARSSLLRPTRAPPSPSLTSRGSRGAACPSCPGPAAPRAPHHMRPERWAGAEGVTGRPWRLSPSACVCDAVRQTGGEQTTGPAGAAEDGHQRTRRGAGQQQGRPGPLGLSNPHPDEAPHLSFCAFTRHKQVRPVGGQEKPHKRDLPVPSGRSVQRAQCCSGGPAGTNGLPTARTAWRTQGRGPADASRCPPAANTKCYVCPQETVGRGHGQVSLLTAVPRIRPQSCWDPQAVSAQQFRRFYNHTGK